MPAAPARAKTTESTGLLTRLGWALPFCAAALPIALLTLYTERVSSESVQSLVARNNLSEAASISELITQDFRRTVSLAHAIASLPGTLDVIRSRDVDATRSRLRGVLVAYPQVDRAFITDDRGRMWSEYPATENAFARNVSGEMWFRDVSATRTPAISAVYLNAQQPPRPVVAIAVPVLGGRGDLLAVLAFEYPLSQITKWLRNSKLSTQGAAFVLDGEGNVAAHPTLVLSDRLHGEYADLGPVKQALSGTVVRSEYRDPLTDEQMLAAFMPFSAGDAHWVVGVQQSAEQAYEPLRRVRLSIWLAGGALSLITLSLVLVLARLSARNERLNRELRSTNQSLRDVASIVASSNDAIIAETLDGTVTAWNAAAERMYGWKEREMVGQAILRTIPEARRKELQGILKRIGRGTTVKHFETERLRKDGKTIPVSLTISPLMDAAGRITGASAIARDITERKLVERMKDDVISVVSHQLKAPITAIRWTLELLLDGTYGKLPAPVRKALKDLQETNATNHRFVLDILNVSRIDRGVIAVTLLPASLKEIVELAVRPHRPAFIQQGLSLKIEAPKGDVRVLADKEKLAEAIGNSVSNALKHTKTGGITVRISTDAGKARVDVTDTGEGMTQDIIRRLFTRDQVLSGGAGADKSAGLGLYIARNFMHLQHGEIEASSELGKGSTFTYRIPLAGSRARKH